MDLMVIYDRLEKVQAFLDPAGPAYEAVGSIRANIWRATESGRDPGGDGALRCRVNELEAALKAEKAAHTGTGGALDGTRQVCRSLRAENDQLRQAAEARRTDDEARGAAAIGGVCGGAGADAARVTLADLMAALPAGHSVTFTAPDWKGDDGGDS